MAKRPANILHSPPHRPRRPASPSPRPPDESHPRSEAVADRAATRSRCPSASEFSSLLAPTRTTRHSFLSTTTAKFWSIMAVVSSGLLSLLLVLLASPPAAPRLVELSYTYNKDAPTSPKLLPFNMTVLKKGYNELGIWVELNEFCTSEHSGTHVDAPIHFARDTWALDEIPLERLWRVPGVLIDVSEAAAASKERNYAIPVEELEAWESRHGVIPDGAVVLLRTGWGAKSHDLADYSGLDAERQNNFPGLSEAAATWLATHGSRHNHPTGVVGVGIDTISVDVGNSTHYLAHQAMYSRNVFGMENMNNLDKLPATNFVVTVMPMRIGGGSGAPARIIAEVSDKPEGVPMPRQISASAATGLHAELPLLLLAAGLLLVPRLPH